MEWKLNCPARGKNVAIVISPQNDIHVHFAYHQNDGVSEACNIDSNINSIIDVRLSMFISLLLCFISTGQQLDKASSRTTTANPTVHDMTRIAASADVSIRSF